LLPSTLTVTNNLDSGSGSLRAVINKANKGDTIVFTPSLDGQTITLTSGELLIKKNITINGPGAAQLTISAGHTSRIFEVAAKYSLSLSGLTISNGFADSTQLGGGGILNDWSATLTVTNTTLSGNSASGGGGAIYNVGTLTVSSSTLSGNSADYGGAIGIGNSSGTATITNSTFSGNHCQGGDFGEGEGGAIYGGGTLTVTGCTLTDNSADGVGGAICVGGGSSTVTINGCTITNNSAAAGGGIYNDPYSPASLTVSNTTFSGNSGGDIYGPFIDGGGNTLG
jgi:predicted outer membrane repeat protein